jgi:hypothetical protein
MSIDDEVASIVNLYEEGLLTRMEVWSRLVELLTSTNIDQVVGATPAELRNDFVGHLRSISGNGPLIYLDGSLYRYEFEADPGLRAEMKAEVERKQQLERAQFENVVRPAIREWVRTHI